VNMIRNVVCALVLATCGCSAQSTVEVDDGSTLKITPPSRGVYLGAYDWRENDRNPGVKEFEEAIGAKVAITSGGVCVSSEGRPFSVDESCLRRLYEKGYVVLIDVVPRGYSPRQIIEGEADQLLAEVADAIKSANVPVMLAYPREPELQPRIGFDGGGYGLRGEQMRGEVDDPYGAYGCTDRDDPMCLDGPERYRDMCRHIHDVIEMHSPGIATWVAGAAVTFWPGNETSSQHYELFYPGDAYVDWHAINVYPAWSGDSDDLRTSKKWGEIVDPIWAEITRISPDKPVIITEFGLHSQAGGTDAWFIDFFAEARTNPKYSNLKAFIYWQMGEDAFDGSNCRIRRTDSAAETWKSEVLANRSFWFSDIKTSGGMTVTGSGGGL
jgi:hypothetical protein